MTARRCDRRCSPTEEQRETQRNYLPPSEKESNVSVIKTHNLVVLEPASQALVEATAKPPFLYELSPAEARAALDEIRAAPIDKLPVNARWTTVPADLDDVRVRIVRPPDAVGALPVILYMHGGGWVLGNAATQDRLVRELAVGTGAAVVFLAYDPRRTRTGVRDRPVDRARGGRQPARPEPDRRRRRLGRRQHCRRAQAHGARARRRALRAPVALLPGHRRRDGHRLLRAVRRGLLPDREDDGLVLGRLRARHRAAPGSVRVPASRRRRAARRPPARLSDRRRGRRAARRGRGLRRATACGRDPGHHRPLRRHHTRLHDAEPAQRHARDTRRDRAGHRDPAQRPEADMSVSDSITPSGLETLKAMPQATSTKHPGQVLAV